MGIISILHAFMIRKEYLIRLEAKKGKDIANQENLKRKLKEEYKQIAPKVENGINTVDRKERSTEMLEMKNKSEIFEKKPDEIVDKIKGEYKQSPLKIENLVNTVESKVNSSEIIKNKPMEEDFKKKLEVIIDKNSKESDNSISCNNCRAHNLVTAKFSRNAARD